MTVPLDTVNDIRSMDAAGRSRPEIARMFHVSRNTVSKHASMKGVTPRRKQTQRRRDQPGLRAGTVNLGKIRY